MRSSPDSAKSTSPTEPKPPTLQAFREAHSRADAFCREVQGFVEEAGIPAVNELRYAGYHLISALDDSGGIVDPANLIKAINHANRACYEAGEAGILCALDLISEFKNDYKDITISLVVSDYVTILREAEEAKQRVITERDHGDDQIIDHDDFIQHFKILKTHCSTLTLGREELNKVSAKGRQDSRRFILTTALVVLGIVVAIVVGVPPLLKHDPVAPSVTAAPPTPIHESAPPAASGS